MSGWRPPSSSSTSGRIETILSRFIEILKLRVSSVSSALTPGRYMPIRSSSSIVGVGGMRCEPKRDSEVRPAERGRVRLRPLSCS